LKPYGRPMGTTFQIAEMAQRSGITPATLRDCCTALEVHAPPDAQPVLVALFGAAG